MDTDDALWPIRSSPIARHAEAELASVSILRQAPTGRDHDRLKLRVHVRLVEDALYMVADRVRRDAEPFGNLCVRQSLPHEGGVVTRTCGSTTRSKGGVPSSLTKTRFAGGETPARKDTPMLTVVTDDDSSGRSRSRAG